MPSDGIVHLLDGHAADPRQVQPPPDVLLYHYLLPGRVSEQAVEAGTFAKEHLWECSREVNRHQFMERLGYGLGMAELQQH